MLHGSVRGWYDCNPPPLQPWVNLRLLVLSAASNPFGVASTPSVPARASGLRLGRAAGALLDVPAGRYTGHMTRIMTVTEVKAKLLALLDDVEAGEQIAITRHGVMVALLAPAKGPHALRGRFTGTAASAADDDELFRTGAAWDLP